MVKVRKNIVSNSVASKVTYGGTNPKKYIVIHETANTSKGANADAHGRLQANGNSRQASWHYTVDDKEAVQSFSDNAQCWHAGSTKYNKEAIGIEICVNSDGNYKKAVDNAIDLTKQLMRKYGISASNVIQHNTASGKDCPKYLRAGNKGITWAQFKAKLSDNKTSNTNTSTSSKKPATSSKTTNKSIEKMAQEVIDGKHGNGHDARRKSLGISKAEYEKVRKEVNAITSGKKKKPTTTKTIQQMANEVKKGLHGNGHETRRKSLGISKSEYEKVRKLVNTGTHPSSGKSISQMATEVLAGKHGQGHANRQKSLGVDSATYAKVRAEVNKRLQ